MGEHESASISRAQWTALTAALLGWMFDGAEMGVFSMVGRPALIDLMPGVEESLISLWFGVITAAFLVGAATGGVLFGWLGDRIGRVRAMTLSVLMYALFTGLCGLSVAAWQMGVLRFLAALGMGGEWSLGVALVMEVWPNRSRAFMAGLIGAAANVGYLLVGAIGLGLAGVLQEIATFLAAIGVGPEWIDWLTHNQGWRILMILGTTPALLTFFIRLFVPESERWLHERQRGVVSAWLTRDLVGVLVGGAGPALIIYLWAWPHGITVRLVGSVIGLAIVTAGYTYPVVRFLQRRSTEPAPASSWLPTYRRMLLAAGLSGVALLGTWGATQWAPTWADKLTNGDPAVGAKYYVQMLTAGGAVVGTILAALTGDWLGRRRTYCLLCILSLVSLLVFYQGNRTYGPFFLLTAFVMGGCTATFYGWLPLYLPELFRTSVRATGQGFSFNFGRIIAAIGALQTGNLFRPEVHLFGRTFEGGYPFACSVMSSIYLVGLVLIWWAPETKGNPLPE
ncbi:MAG: MFS transporter [Gemmataceae bacterium]|nr:MFS transporter [Gemmataceae bacterium]MDW8264686.1 MFS transporter [Gemmataceae bacterium]